MAAEKEHIETDGEILFHHELSEDDPFFQTKKKLLEGLSFHTKKPVSLKRSSDLSQINSILDMILQQARIIHLNEIELFFVGTNVSNLVGFLSPRNELEALHYVLGLIARLISSSKHDEEPSLVLMHDGALDLIDQVGKFFGEITTVVQESNCEKESCLMRWGRSDGVQTKLDIAYVEAAGRGAIGRENLKLGDIALEIPVSLIIFEKDVVKSDMFPVLEKIEGISSEIMLLLWSMKEKNNPCSKYKLYFDSLPEAFNTGLSFDTGVMMALDGTTLLEDIVQAKEHLRTQCDQLFPALSENYPDAFPPVLYTWAHFLWACELWYSNSLKIMFADGNLRTCLVPIAGLLNHSTCPHILHYGKVDLVTNSVKFPLSRPCNAGEQCFLSYGNLSSSRLLTFYGFMPKQENPYNNIPLNIDVVTDEDCEDGRASEWETHMVRGTWFSNNTGIFNYMKEL